MSGNFFKHPLALLRVLYPALSIVPFEPEKHADGQLWHAAEVACFLAVSEETGGVWAERAITSVSVTSSEYRSKFSDVPEYKIFFHQNRIFSAA